MFTRLDGKVVHVTVLTAAEVIVARIDAPKLAALTQALKAGTPPRAAVHAQTTGIARESVAP